MRQRRQTFYFALLCWGFAEARLGSYITPQYDLLDPWTGRSIRNPQTRISPQFSSFHRPQREISSPDSFVYALPMSPHRLSEQEGTRVQSSRDARQIQGFGDLQLELQDPEQHPEESSRGSRGHRFYRVRPSSTFYGFHPIVEDSVKSREEDQSYKLALRNAKFNLFGGTEVNNEVPSSAGYIDLNKDKGRSKKILAYKWRKKYPYYGGRRKRRSAQRRLSEPLRREQTTWVLLDPLTGRVKNNPFQARKSGRNPGVPEAREEQIYKFYKRYPYKG